ncbi:MAG: response regulator [Candidatus Omnitrophota bacterium]|nr:response regulator [Candidatus Omnitrophota bacterium]
MSKILIVDDEPVIIDILTKLLLLNNFEVLSSVTGEDVIDILNRGEKIDLVILDMKMPKIRGTDILKKMREFDMGVPVLILTGSIDKYKHEEEFKQFGLNLDDVWQKPVDLYLLLEKIKSKLMKS